VAAEDPQVIFLVRVRRGWRKMKKKKERKEEKEKGDK
jgi:hypothetical protein